MELEGYFYLETRAGHFYTTTLNQKKIEQIFHKNFDLAKNWQNEFEIDQKWYFWHFFTKLGISFSCN